MHARRSLENLQLPENIPQMPITDAPISPLEVSKALQSLKGNKSGGPSGVPPGLLKLLPANWIAFLAMLFSVFLLWAAYHTTIEGEALGMRYPATVSQGLGITETGTDIAIRTGE
jgi:hypothetical protein